MTKTKERKTVKVSANSWHGRAYRYWAKNAVWERSLQNPNRKRENLCHYVRVVVLWAPLEWLIYGEFKRFPWLHPWMPFALVDVIAVLTVSFMRWPKGTWEWLGYIGIGVLMVIALLGMAVAIQTVSDWHRNRDRKTKEPKAEKGDRFTRVAIEFVRAKKARVCPYIDLEDMR